MSTSRYQRNAPTIGGSADVRATNRQDGYVLAWSNAEESHIYTPQGADPSIDARITALEETYVRNTRYATVTSTTGTVTIPEGAAIILNDFGGELDCDVQRIEAGRPNGEAAFDTDGLVIVSSFDTDGNFVLSGTPADASVALVYRVRQKFSDYDDTDVDIVGIPFKEMPEYYRVNLTSADSPYSPPSIKNTIYAVDLDAGSVVINLPEVSEIIEGDSCIIYIERVSGTNDLTINTYGAQTIRGATTQVLRALRDGVTLVAHTFLTDHWDAMSWSRTDEVIYNPGNAGVTSIRTLQNLLNHSLSSGQISGCVVSSNGDGTIAVSAGEWKLRAADTAIADCRVYAVPAIASIEPTDNATSYLVVNYSGGSPSWTIVSDITTVACQSTCIQAVIYRRGTAVHLAYLGAYSTDFMASYAKAEAATNWLRHGGGLQVSSPSARTLSVTSGALYQGTVRFATPAFDTAGADTMTFWYRNGAGEWTTVASQTALGNTQYDDGDGTLANLSANRYANWWVFTLIDNPSTLVAVYPQTQHTSIANARAEGVPAVLPPWAARYSIGKLIAKVMVRQGSASVVEIASPFTTVFTSTSPVNHNDLSALQGGTVDQYYHLTQAQHTIATQEASATVDGYVTTGTQTIAGEKTFSAHPVSTDTDTPATNELIPVSKLGAVMANSTAKTTPIDADSVGISDSADGGILKKLTWANLKATLLNTAMTWVGKQTFDGGAAIKGATSAVAAGYAGEIITTPNPIAATSLTTSEADVTNASLTLTPGQWRIEYSVTCNYTTGAAAGANGLIRVAITDSANTRVGNSARAVNGFTPTTTAITVLGCASASIIVTVGSTTTYKLRAVRIDNSSVGIGTIDVSGANPKNYECAFYATRIA